MAQRKLSIREASAYTGMPTGTISYAAKCDPPRLRSFKSGSFGPYWFDKSDLDVWVAGMATAPAPQCAPRATTKRIRAGR